MLTNSDDKKILEGIIAIARSFDIRALAEGIETPAQGVLLKQLGYRYGQGYAIAKPMPADEAIIWFSNWQAPPEWNCQTKGVETIQHVH